MQRTAFCIHHYRAVMPAEGDCGELRNGRFASIVLKNSTVEAEGDH
jgi:hypothetical protein